MATVDSRIVTIKFDNKEFEKNAGATMSTLDKLKTSMDLGATGKIANGFSGITSGLRNLGNESTGVSGKFVAMASVIATSVSRVTNQIIDQVGSMVKQVSGVQAMADGYSDYNAKLTSVQTVMNATGKSLEYVSEQFDKLDIYADETIYSMNDMTSAFAKFANAGVDIEDAVVAIEGIGNATAYAGQGSAEAALAYRNFSDAISKGYLGGGDFLSLKNSNVITKQFKEEMIEAGLAVGTLKKNADGTFATLGEGSNKASVSAAELFNVLGATQWADVEVLMKTLQKFGDTTTEIGKKAKASATDVKDFPMLLETLSASAGTGWTETFELIIGNLDESKELWTGVADVIGGIIGAQAKSRNDMLKAWKDLGGRDELLEGLGNIWKAIVAIIKPIHDAFRAIFPPKTGKDLYNLTVGFRKFTEMLIIGEDTARYLKNAFSGVFSILKIGIVVLKGVAEYIGDFFGIIIGGGGGSAVLSVFGAIGKLITAIGNLITGGNRLGGLFDGLIAARNAILEPMVKVISNLVKGFADLATGDSAGFFDRMGVAGKFLNTVMDKLRDAFEAISDYVGFDVIPSPETLAKIGSGFVSVGKAIGAVVVAMKPLLDFAKRLWDGMSEISSALKNFLVRMIDDMGGEEAVALINTTFFILLYKTIKNYVDLASDYLSGFTDITGALKGALEQTTESLKAMALGVKAKAVLNIAIAVGILAAALLVLSKIPPKELLNATGAIAGLMTALVLSMMTLGKWGPAGAALVVATSSAMVIMASAVLILVGSLKILEQLDAEKGLHALAQLGFLMTMMTMMAVAMGYVGPMMILGSAGMFIMALALVALYPAIILYQGFDWKDFAKGVGMMAISMLVLGAALTGMAASIFGAAALLVAAPALIALAGALKIYGSMDLKTILTGLLALGGLLGILAVGMTAMIVALPGAVALTVIAGALALLIPAFAFLGSLKISTILKGLGTLAAIFAVLGVAGILLGPVIPVLVALGLTMLLIGGSLALAGAGMLAFGTGFAVLAATGTAGVATLTAAVTGIAALIPLILEQIGLGILALAKVIGEGASQLITAFANILLSMLEAGNKIMPEFRDFMINLGIHGLEALQSLSPYFVETGFKLLLDFLKGWSQNIGEITHVVASIAIKFIAQLSKEQPRMLQAGANFVIDFINNLAETIRKNAKALNNAGWNLGTAVLEGMLGGLASAPARIAKGAINIGQKAINGIGGVLGVHSPSRVFKWIGEQTVLGFILGMEKLSRAAGLAAEGVGDEAVDTINLALVKMAEDLPNSMDFDPVITPVLDLTNLQAEATRINGLLSTNPINAGVSFSQASGVVASQTDRQNAQAENAPVVHQEIKFEQTNNSPKALSTVEIYRNTKSQLSLAKEALDRS